MAWDGYVLFLRQFRDHFHTTGAIAPSSPALARAITEPFRRRDRPARVLEVGPGTGAFTGHLVRDLRPGETLDLVEANGEFVRHLRDFIAAEPDFRRAADRVRVIEGYVPDALPDGRYDYIVSGLPLNNFEPDVVEGILEGLMGALADDGVLSYFEYLAIRGVKRLFVNAGERERLDAITAVVDRFIRRHQFREDHVYLNLPPACARHLRRAAGRST